MVWYSRSIRLESGSPRLCKTRCVDWILGMMWFILIETQSAGESSYSTAILAQRQGGSVVGERAGSGFKTRIFHEVAMCPWAGNLSFLSLSFCIYEMKIPFLSYTL